MRAGASSSQPFAGLIDAVIVDDPVPFAFPGSVARSLAQAVWIWVNRDLCQDIDISDLEQVMPDVLARMREAVDGADADYDNGRRLRAALGNDEARAALPVIMAALRNRAVLDKAQAFGRAVNTIADEAALGTAIHSMPLQDPPLAALLFHAAMGQVANPSRVVGAVIKLSGNSNEGTVARAGFGPVIDAILAHAQNQLHLLQPSGPFSDIDLMCRALDRFHRLVRALTGYVEFARGSRWSMVLSAITKQISDRIEPRLKDVVPDINQALRKPREGADRLDNDRLLAALNGVYLLSAIRDSRDSLALNALFDQAWNQSGQTLEMHLQRNLELLRQNPDDKIVGTRMEAGIKMAEIRFNPEYAETLRRARAAAERRG
ncbi:hypothetical protein GCM10007913_21940 [Devosia yakushimensis]|uniref:Uncharacterized protein n=2 Tax=Devosia yakushimensis TaxID=470028 RepID=A0ABQ5UDU8_9HYPH|nr:hypothetical protein GCM10007913_21940 [Devosia yakushimensis]